MKKVIYIIICLFIVGATVADAAGVNWVTLKEGTEQAKIEKKPMLVDFFFNEECPRCARLVKNVYSNAMLVEKINRDFVPIKIDLTKKLSPEEDALGKAYDYKNDCLLLFLDSNGNIVKDPGGKKLCFIDDIDPEIFGNYLDMVREKLK